MSKWNKFRFTNASVLRCRYLFGSYTTYWDSMLTGFGIRAHPGGAASYVVQRDIEGKATVVILGRVGEVKLSEVRRMAEEVVAQQKSLPLRDVRVLGSFKRILRLLRLTEADVAPRIRRQIQLELRALRNPRGGRRSLN